MLVGVAGFTHELIEQTDTVYGPLDAISPDRLPALEAPCAPRGLLQGLQIGRTDGACVPASRPLLLLLEFARVMRVDGGFVGGG